MPSIIKLSPSSISLFLECPRCFWLKFNKKVKRPSGIFPSLPSGMDRILKDHFDEHRVDGSHPEELEKIAGKLFDDLEKLNVWRNNFKGLQYEESSSGALLRGAIDDLFVTSEGLFAPLDFKTRGYPMKDNTHEHYQHQMDIYSFLLEKNGMKPAGFAILLFYHPKCINSHCNVEFHADTIKIPASTENGERLFRDGVECITGDEPDVKCEWCERVLT